MIALLTVAVLSAAPSITGPESGFGGELVATWVYEDGPRHIAINLDADGRCSVVARHRGTGTMNRVLCGYWLNGSTLYLRARTDTLGARPILEMRHDRETDELLLRDGAELMFTRRPLQERFE